jgi:hypothetical protein
MTHSSTTIAAAIKSTAIDVYKRRPRITQMLLFGRFLEFTGTTSMSQTLPFRSSPSAASHKKERAPASTSPSPKVQVVRDARAALSGNPNLGSKV